MAFTFNCSRAFFPRTPRQLLVALSCKEKIFLAKRAARFLRDLQPRRHMSTSSRATEYSWVPLTLLLDTSSRADTSDGLCICHKSVSIGGGGGSGKQVAVVSTGNISSGVSTRFRFNSSTSDCNLSSQATISSNWRTNLASRPATESTRVSIFSVKAGCLCWSRDDRTSGGAGFTSSKWKGFFTSAAIPLGSFGTWKVLPSSTTSALYDFLDLPHTTQTFYPTAIVPLLTADLFTTDVAPFNLPSVHFTTIFSILR